MVKITKAVGIDGKAWARGEVYEGRWEKFLLEIGKAVPHAPEVKVQDPTPVLENRKVDPAPDVPADKPKRRYRRKKAKE